MYSMYKLNKQGDNIQSWCIPFPIWLGRNYFNPVVHLTSTWLLLHTSLECPWQCGQKLGLDWIFGIRLDFILRADGSQESELVSALPAGREAGDIIHAIGRAVPTGKSWDRKARKDIGDYLRSFISPCSQGSRPGKMNGQSEATEPLVQNWGLASTHLVWVPWLAHCTTSSGVRQGREVCWVLTQHHSRAWLGVRNPQGTASLEGAPLCSLRRHSCLAPSRR